MDLPQLALMAHYSFKKRVIIEKPVEATALPLTVLYLLAPREEYSKESISITRLQPTDSCMTIISNSFQLDVNDKQRAINRLRDSAIICQSVPVYRLEYVRDFSALPALRAAILKHADHCLANPE
jgi:hypothetical protein